MPDNNGYYKGMKGRDLLIHIATKQDAMEETLISAIKGNDREHDKLWAAINCAKNRIWKLCIVITAIGTPLGIGFGGESAGWWG